MYYPIKTRLLQQKYRKFYEEKISCISCSQTGGNNEEEPDNLSDISPKSHKSDRSHRSDISHRSDNIDIFPDTLCPEPRKSYKNISKIINLYTSSNKIEMENDINIKNITDASFIVPSDHVYKKYELKNIIEHNSLASIILTLVEAYNKINEKHNEINNVTWLYNLRYIIAYANYACTNNIQFKDSDNSDNPNNPNNPNNEEDLKDQMINIINKKYPEVFAAHEIIVCRQKVCIDSTLEEFSLCSCENDPFNNNTNDTDGDTLKQKFKNYKEIDTVLTDKIFDKVDTIEIEPDRILESQEIEKIIKNNTMASVYFTIVDTYNKIIESHNQAITRDPFIESYCDKTNAINNLKLLKNIELLLLYANYVSTHNLSFKDEKLDENKFEEIDKFMNDNKINITFFRIYKSLIENC
jgi:hypothetical protein